MNYSDRGGKAEKKVSEQTSFSANKVLFSRKQHLHSFIVAGSLLLQVKANPHFYTVS